MLPENPASGNAGSPLSPSEPSSRESGNRVLGGEGNEEGSEKEQERNKGKNPCAEELPQPKRRKTEEKEPNVPRGVKISDRGESSIPRNTTRVGSNPPTAQQRETYAEFGINTSTDNEANEDVDEELASSSFAPEKGDDDDDDGDGQHDTPRKGDERKSPEEKKSEHGDFDDGSIFNSLLRYFSSDSGVDPSPESIGPPNFSHHTAGLCISAAAMRKRILMLKDQSKKESGENPDPATDSNEIRELFELSRGTTETESSSGDGHGKKSGKEPTGNQEEEQSTNLSAYPYLMQSLNEVEPMLREKLGTDLGLIGKAKKEELDDKWRQLEIEESTLHLKRLDLILEPAKLVLNKSKPQHQL